MFRKKSVIILLFMFLCLFTTPAYAKKLEPANNKKNIMIKQANTRDQLALVDKKLNLNNGISIQNLKKLKNVSNVLMKEEAIDKHYKKVIFQALPKKPIRTQKLKSGQVKKTYHSISYIYIVRQEESPLGLKRGSGQISESEFINSDVTIKLDIYYDYINLKKPKGDKITKFTKAGITISKFCESNLNNLKMTAFCNGDQYKSNQKRVGVGKESLRMSTISKPKLKTRYYITPKFKYYYKIDSHGILGINSSVSYKHGKTNYTAYFDLRYGALASML